MMLLNVKSFFSFQLLLPMCSSSPLSARPCCGKERGKCIQNSSITQNIGWRNAAGLTGRMPDGRREGWMDGWMVRSREMMKLFLGREIRFLAKNVIIN